MNGIFKIVLGLIFAGVLLQAEPSVYGRGLPGGGVSKNRAMILSLRQKVADLKEELEGLKTLVRSLQEQLRQNRASQNAAVSAEEFANLKARLDRLEQARKQSAKPRTAPKPAASAGKPKAPTADPLLKADSSKLYSRGVRLVSKKRYAEARRRFVILLSRHYKPAASNFYMGEIAYRSGKYADAIKYYQKSAELNENAAYMDRLLLHTALALEKMGDKEQAKRFFQAIVDGYPGTGSAAVAKKHLK